MEDVQFDESIAVRPFETNRQQKKGGLTNLFIKFGLAKDEKQAKYIMFGLIIVCLSLIIYINISTFAHNLFQFGQKKALPTNTGKFLHQTPQDLNAQ